MIVCSEELVESSPENRKEMISALKSRWSEAARDRSVGERRSMLKKLVGRLSQKINPEVNTTKPSSVNTEPHGGCVGTASCHSEARLIATSTCHHHIYNANYYNALPVCYHHRELRTTLSIYRSSLQSCAAETASANGLTNNCDKPMESVCHQSNQVCLCHYCFCLSQIDIFFFILIAETGTVCT